jgi:hypothetical protein
MKYASTENDAEISTDREELLHACDLGCEIIDALLRQPVTRAWMTALEATAETLRYVAKFNARNPDCPLTGDDDLSVLVAARAAMIRRLRLALKE